MKKFEAYKNIRKGAMIWGLPISLFAMMMLSILSSLLIIIFSFSFVVIIAAAIWNGAFYIALTRASTVLSLLNFNRVFPKIISNKNTNTLNYVED